MNKTQTPALATQLQWPLLSLRVGVFIVMIFWTLDKFIAPDHASAILAGFYGISNAGNVIVYLIGAVQLLILLAFLLGIKKRLSYGAIFLLHGISTLVTLPRMIGDPFNNLLFFAALPMLAACFTLYILRDYDTKMSL